MDPRPTLNVSIALENIHCFNNGEWWGSQSPYLWTVFYKIDGATCFVTDDLKLAGTPTLVTTPGSHGNLGTTDVNDGDDVTIPDVLGSWQDSLVPIPMNAALRGTIPDLPGFCGVIIVLMEENGVSDSGAEGGHAGLNTSVQSALQQIINTRDISHQKPTQDDINALKGQIHDAVRNGIVNAQNFFQNIWSWLDGDDSMGSAVEIFSTDDFLQTMRIDIDERMQDDGDWELTGWAIGAQPCTITNLFSMHMEKSALPPIESLQAFRSRLFSQHAGLASWWEISSRHAANLAGVLLSDASARSALTRLLHSVPKLVEQKEARFAPDILEPLQIILEGLRTQGSRKARVEATRLLRFLETQRGETVAQVLKTLASTPVTKYEVRDKKDGKPKSKSRRK